MAAVHAHYFPPVPPPPEDCRYEPDVGMLSGEDGGYCDVSVLQRERAWVGQQAGTAVYMLLGDDGGEEATVGTPKRPRRGWGLADQLEHFIRELRVACEPHRDAAQEESKGRKDVPKNTHRKAVSAASVVEELKEMEHKVRIGKIERVEECISAVSACIGNQGQTFAAVLSQIKEKAELLRAEQQRRKERFESIEHVTALTTGILGARSKEGQKQDEEQDEEQNEHQDKERGEEEVDGEVGEEVDNSREAQSGDATPNTTKAPDSIRNAPLSPDPSIPFSEGDLSIWPTGGEYDLPLPSPHTPRVPIFEEVTSTDAVGEPPTVARNANSLVDILGEQHNIVRTVRTVQRVRSLRCLAFDNYTLLRELRASMNPQSLANKPKAAAPSDAKVEKTENVLPVLSVRASSPKPRTPTRKQSAKVPDTATGSVPLPSPVEEYVIKIDPFDSKLGSSHCTTRSEDSRQRALAKSVCAIILSHSTFTHSSSAALDILTDALTDFVERIGRSLASCRENIDRFGSPGRSRKRYSLELDDPAMVSPRSFSRDEVGEALRLITSSGFRGGFPELESYARLDLFRCEQAARSAEASLRVRVTRAQLEVSNSGGIAIPAKSSDEVIDPRLADKSVPIPNVGTTARPHHAPVASSDENASMPTASREENEVVLDESAYLFGHLSKDVSIDVLGNIRVPRELSSGNVPPGGRNAPFRMESNLGSVAACCLEQSPVKKESVTESVETVMDTT